MSVEQEIIQVIIDAKDDEAKQASRTLEQLNNQAKALDASFKATTITEKQWRDGLNQIAKDAEVATNSLQSLRAEMRSMAQQGGLATPKLVGTDRAAGIAQFGMTAANTLQDMIQGGAGSGVNNILGALGNGKIRALVGEFIEAAGGASALTSAVVKFGGAGLAAFNIVGGALERSKLGWGDLSSVVDEMAGGAFSKAAENIASGLKQIDGTIDGMTDGVLNYYTGWDRATEAVRDHKAELERTAKIFKEQAEDAKFLSGLKSDAQVEGKKRGDLVGTELANLAGPKGIDDLIDQLVTARIGPGDGGKRVVDKPIVDDKGQPTGKTKPVEVTGREEMAATLKGIMRGATDRGEQASMQAIIGTLKNAGFDTTALEQAAKGIDPKEAAKADQKQAKEDRDAEKDAFNAAEKDRVGREYKEFRDRTTEMAKPLQERFDQTTATGGTVTRDMVRGKLVAGGASADEADKQADSVLGQLREGYADRIRKLAGENGTDAAGAAGLIADEGARKRQQAEDKEQRDADALARDRREEFEGRTAGTGIEDRAGRSIVLDAMHGASYDQLRDNAIANATAEAQMGGMDAESAGLAATEFVDKLLNKLGESRVEANLNRETKAPASFSALDFTNQVQSAGASDAKQTQDLIKQTNSKLDELIRKPAGGATF